MKVKKLVVLAVLLVLAGALMAACTGQGGTTSSGGGDNNTGVSSTGASTTAPGNVSAFDALPEKPVRVATTEEDYQIFNGFPENDIYVTKNMQQRISTGNKLYIGEGDIISEYGYYGEDRQSGHVIKNLYYSVPEVSLFVNFGKLIGTYGDIPAIELNRQTDIITARDNSNGNITAYRCKLVGCTIGWVDSESAIWNQNDLIPVSDPSSLQLVDLNGQPRSTPMDYEFGEGLTVERDGIPGFQASADSYVYAVDDIGIEITGGDVKVKYDGGISDVFFGYDFSKLEPGLYYFQDLGVYKIV